MPFKCSYQFKINKIMKEKEEQFGIKLTETTKKQAKKLSKEHLGKACVKNWFVYITNKEYKKIDK